MASGGPADGIAGRVMQSVSASAGRRRKPDYKLAREAVRGVLTRLALGFNPRKVYSGEEVQEILIAAMLSIDEVPTPDAALSLPCR
jgi:hypothetical protein